MAAAPTPFVCLEQGRLLKALADAMAAITRLQQAQLADVINGGDGLPRMDLALTRARREWERAREIYLVNVALHGY